MRRRRVWAIPVVAAVGVGATLAVSSALPPPAGYQIPVGWTTQFGTSGNDQVTSIAKAPSGDLYVAGSTQGGFAGFPVAGFAKDAFIARFDRSGNRMWVVQFGSAGTEEINDIAVSSTGDVYVVGETTGDLDGAGPGPIGLADAFLARYDKNGVRKWLRHLGSPAQSTYMESVAVAGSNDIYLLGQTWGDFDGAGAGTHAGLGDGLLLRYDRNGNQKWARQFGSTNTDLPSDVAVRGSSEIYVLGSTFGDADGPGGEPFLGGTDAVLARWDRNGNRIWVRQFGTFEPEFVNGLAVYGSNEVYVAGSTYGDMDGGGPGLAGDDGSGYVVRWDRSGNPIWTAQFGDGLEVIVEDLAVASSSALYVLGRTRDDLDGAGGLPAHPSSNHFLLRLNNAGTELGLRMFGPNDWETEASLALTSSKRPVVAAPTLETLWGHANAGSYDAFVIVMPS